jgi:polyvinyl alcohol dehydrogenase (cytochrome)
MVSVGTGNNYTAPDSAVACEQAAQDNNTSDAGCTAPNDYFDSVLALNLGNGRIVWGNKIEGWDAWTVACFFLPPGVTWCRRL